MGIGYGSRFDLAQLSTEEVGAYDVSGNGRPDLTWLSWLLTGLEIGASFFVNPALGTAIAIAGQSAQFGIEYAETGTVSPISIGVGVGSLALPGALQLSKGVRAASKINEGFRQISEIGKDVLTPITSNVGRYAGKKITKEFTRDLVNQIVTNRTLLAQEAGLKFTFENSRYIAKDVVRGLDTLEKIGLIEKIGVKGATETSEEIERRNVINKARKLFGLSAAEVRALQKIVRSGLITDQKAFLNILRTSLERTGNAATAAAIEGLKFTKIARVVNGEATGVARIASKTWNISKKSLQYVLNPTSLVAKVLDKATESLEEMATKWGNSIGKSIAKWFKKGAKTSKELAEQFTRTGGKLVSSSWIMGYKVITNAAAQITILIQFDMLATASKTGINIKGKKPVIVNLSQAQFAAFIKSKSKGRWYINNIARSRGGRNLAAAEWGEELSNLIGLLPVDKISKILELTSLGQQTFRAIKTRSSIFGGIGNFTNSIQNAVIGEVIGKATELVGFSLSSNSKIRSAISRGLEGSVTGQGIGASFSKSFQTSLGSQLDEMRDRSYSGREQAKSFGENIKSFSTFKFSI